MHNFGIFIQNGQLFFWHLFESLQLPNNKVDNFETIYTTMVLLFIEVGADEVLLDMFRLALNVQVYYFCVFVYK
jgi:hypothetical protein